MISFFFVLFPPSNRLFDSAMSLHMDPNLLSSLAVLFEKTIFQPWQKTSKYLAELIMVQCFRVDVCIVWFCCLLDGIWCSLSVQKGVDPEIMVSKISSSSLQVELCSCHIINHLSIFNQSLDSMFYIVSKWLPEF